MTNNEITEGIVRIRDNAGLSTSDREVLAAAANRIQSQSGVIRSTTKKVIGLIAELSDMEERS